MQAQEYVKNLESNLTHRAEGLLQQKVLETDARFDAAIKQAENAVSQEQSEKQAAILAAQQAKQRTLELEDSANRGNQYVQALHEQESAYEQAATQRIQQLEEENRLIAENARQQEAALRQRLDTFQNEALDREFVALDRENTLLNQHPAPAQTSCKSEPSESPLLGRRIPDPVPDVDMQDNSRVSSRPPQAADDVYASYPRSR